MTMEKNWKTIDGGVCAPEGFTAAGIAAGIKADSGKKDMALIAGDGMCNVAAVYTQNKVKGAPLLVTRKHLANGKARAIICNSGNANTCAPGGVALAEEACRLTAAELNVAAEDVVVCSTGVIGQKLEIEPFEKGIPVLAGKLAKEGWQDAAEAIMTTDTVSKSIAVEFMLEGKRCRIGGIAKGSGMINPNMATMLSFLTTDVDISSEMLEKVLKEDVRSSFNQICVDGDTSTNDMVVILASGKACNPQIREEGAALEQFKEALSAVTVFLAKKLARDGEGATKLIQCRVMGAPDEETARSISKSVISSNLLKAAMFGEDANWGRMLCAVGYAPGDFLTDHIDVTMSSAKGSMMVCEDSAHKSYSEESAEEILSEEEIRIDIDMNQGEGEAFAWGCDLTYDYVQINGDYRS